jgi:hypothetical protein
LEKNEVKEIGADLAALWELYRVWNKLYKYSLVNEAPSWIKEYSEHGMGDEEEVFDPVLFDKYCPGKSKDIGRKQYFDSFKTAVDIFGFGKVRSNFVAGLEPLDSLFKGFEELGSMGVVPTAMILTRNEGNGLENDFMRPDLDYYIEVYKKLEEIYSKFEISPPWCSKCRTASLENEGMFL